MRPKIQEYLTLDLAEFGPITYFPAPSTVLHDISLFEQRVLLPFLTVPGDVIAPAFAGRNFHLVAHPVGLSELDFRFAADGSYELIAVDGANVQEAGSLAAFIAEHQGDDEHFDSEPEAPAAMAVKSTDSENYYADYAIERGFPSWCQATYEDEELWDQEDVDTTDYANPLLQDEDGNPLVFVMASRSMMDVFGNYYLFYSPATGLLRQFFQCT